MTCWLYMPHLPNLFGKLHQMTCWRYMPHLLLIHRDPMKFCVQALLDRWCPDGGWTHQQLNDSPLGSITKLDSIMLLFDAK